MHELTALAVAVRTAEINRAARRHADGPTLSVESGRRRRGRWRRQRLR
jgi:hypothetical protein